MDLIFHALAHRARRRILDILKAEPGSRVCDLADRFEMSRIGVMKHLGVLSEANLVVSRRQGRERHLYLNPVPLQRIHERWSDEYAEFFASSALALKRRIEALGTKRSAGRATSESAGSRRSPGNETGRGTKRRPRTGKSKETADV